ncbi:hypothetical protein V6R85_01220 [Agrobacterium sp. CCNWLW32]|uniref:hypothetical protein n=1 Tax=Agrobacterium sp. CCNWLW32 TaxID=3122072 RepID=UPI0030102649
MTEHERIWLEPAGAPDRCWCQDNQWGDEGVEYVLASALESLRRDLAACQEQAVKDGNEISRLKDWQAGAISCREAEQARIDEYKARAEAAEAEVKLIREAVGELLDQAEHVCLGAHTPANIKEAARNLATPIKNVHTALASTGGEHHAE